MPNICLTVLICGDTMMNKNGMLSTLIEYVIRGRNYSYLNGHTNRFIITTFGKSYERIISVTKAHLTEDAVIVSGVKEGFPRKLTLN